MGVFVFQKQRWKHLGVLGFRKEHWKRHRRVRFSKPALENTARVSVFSKLTLETPWAVLDFQKQCSRGPSSIGLSKATLETAQQCCLLKPLMATALVTVTWCNVRSLYRRNK